MSTYLTHGRHAPQTEEHREATPEFGSFSGLIPCMLLILRRNWLRMVIWVVVLVSMIPIVYDSQQQAFPTQAARDAYAQVANTPVVAAMTGLPYAAGSLGGILVIKIWMTLAVALAFAVTFLITRNGRADEETGRLELLRSTAVGRHAYTAANYLLAGIMALATGLLIGIASLSMNLPSAGSWIMGVSIAGVGLTFCGVAALCGQLVSTSRGANSLAAAFIGLFYFIRAAADLRAEGTAPSALSWVSPIGWAQNMRAFGADDWWPLLALTVLGVGGCLLALRLETSRDLGAGFIPARRGPEHAAAVTTTTLGLTLRLQRSSLIGWLIAIMVSGLFFGAVAENMSSLLDPNNPFARNFVGSGHTMLDGVLGIFLLFNALLATAFAIQCLGASRSEEENGRLDLQIAGALSRVRWLGAHALVAVAGSGLLLFLGGYLTGAGSQGDALPGDLALSCLVYWPAVLFILGVQLLCFGCVPRLSTTITWTFYGVMAMVAMFGGLFSLSEDVVRATAFGAVGRVPAEDVQTAALVVLIALATVFGIAGFIQFRRRDIVSA